MKGLLFIMLFGLVFATGAQEPSSQEKRSRYIRIPAQSGLVFTAFQPNSPLKFEQVEMLVEEDGAPPILRYVLRNTTRKAIRYLETGYYKKYTVQQWGAYGLGSKIGVGKPDATGTDFMLPGETFEEVRSDQFEIVPMNDTVHKLLISERGDLELKIVFFLYVEKVIFEDGTMFEETKMPQDFSDFLFDDSGCLKLLEHYCPAK